MQLKQKKDLLVLVVVILDNVQNTHHRIGKINCNYTEIQNGPIECRPHISTSRGVLKKENAPPH